MMEAALVQARVYSAHKVPLESVVPLATPFSAHIDVCSICNFRCSFCFQDDKEGMKAVGLKIGHMPIELFRKIVDDLTEFGEPLKKVKIGNHGEPTLHAKLPEMIAYIRERKVAETVELFTNGSKLGPQLNQAMVEAGLQRINISLEGLSTEAYRRVAGVKLDFNELIENVRDLYHRRKQLRIYVKVVDHAIVRNDPNNATIEITEADRKYFFDTFSGICDEIFVENVVPQWPETKQNELQAVGMYGQRINGWKEVCPFVFMYLHFNSDGTAAGCTLDWARKVIIGDAKTESAVAIWNGDKMRDLRLKMLEGRRREIPFCDTCDAPMVCCNEDLDPHAQKLIQLIRKQ